MQYSDPPQSALIYMIDLETMTGLEIMVALVDGRMDSPPIATAIPMRWILAEKGRIVIEATANEGHLNPMGAIHGGFAAAVMDSVTGCVVHTMLEAGVKYGTIELAVKMMRPVPMNTTLIAEGKIINVSRSLGVSEGTLKDESGKLYAHATCTCMIIRH